MRLAVLIGFLVLIGLLAAMNTNFLTYPHTFYLGSHQYKEVPLGLCLLVFMLLPTLLFFFWAGLSKLRALADQSKMLREMEQLRQSLDAKESTRFEALQQHLDARLFALEQQLGSAGQGAQGAGQAELLLLHERLDELQRDLTFQLTKIQSQLPQE